jgi:hypothetical protein
MLNINSLNMYFDGNSSVKKNEEDFTVANFHANYSGEKTIHFSINTDNIEELFTNLDVCIEDFKTFVFKVLNTTNDKD